MLKQLIKKRKGQSITEWIGIMIFVGAIVAVLKSGAGQTIGDLVVQKVTSIFNSL